MWYEVPQPTIAARSPAAGSAAPTAPARATARVQHSGWLAISSVTYGMGLLIATALSCTDARHTTALPFAYLLIISF
jgi:hypothetical protein